MTLCSFHHHKHCRFTGTSVKFCKGKDKEESRGREMGMEGNARPTRVSQWSRLTFAKARRERDDHPNFCKSGSKLRDFK